MTPETKRYKVAAFVWVEAESAADAFDAVDDLLLSENTNPAGIDPESNPGETYVAGGEADRSRKAEHVE